MTDAALLEAIRAVVRQELERARQLDVEPQHVDVVRVAAALYRPGDKFTASEMVYAAGFELEHRQTLQAVCDNDRHRLGVYLGRAADARVVIDGRRLRRLPKEAGVRRWVLEGVEPL
jgi:hypothetical protein